MLVVLKLFGFESRVTDSQSARWAVAVPWDSPQRRILPCLPGTSDQHLRIKPNLSCSWLPTLTHASLGGVDFFLA